MTAGRKTQLYFAGFMLLVSTVTLVAGLAALPVGPIEEHFELAQLLHRTGTLGPRLLRPPGFPAFAAAILWIRDALSAVGLSPLRFSDDIAAAVLGQRLALALFSCFLFREALKDMSAFGAFSLATIFGANPLSIVLAGVLSYPLLDMLLVCLGTLMLSRITRGEPGAPRITLAAGVVWGLTALVKPVALILPAFVLGVAVVRRRRSWWQELRLAGTLALGMAAIVGPYMLRNFRLTGHVVPVCAQGGLALWGASVETPPSGQAYVDWPRLWYRRGMPIFSQVTGSRGYSSELMTRYSVELNDAFGRAAVANITRSPGIYLMNVANHFGRFPLDPSEWWWLCYRWINEGMPMDRNGPAPPPFSSLAWIGLANAFVIALGAAGLAGILIGLARLDPWAEPAAAVYLAYWVGSALSFSQSRYTYVRLPLLVLGLGMLLRAASSSRSASTLSLALARRAPAIVAALVALAILSSLGLILTRP